MQSNDSSPLAAARQYVQSGFTPISVRPGDKAPEARSWTSTRWRGPDDPLLEQVFVGDKNVGLALGGDAGLVDVDLDCDEAVLIARYALPHTEMISGRESVPASHYWYLCPGAVSAKYQDPIRLAQGQADRATLVEVRSTGAQTVVPPSIHPSGERYQWDSFGPLGEEPDIEQEAADLAAVTLLLRYWPGKGARHDAFMCLAGGLMTSGSSYWSERRVAAVVKVLALLTNDDEVDSRLASVATTATEVADGNHVKGWQSLATLFGPNADAVWTAREWMLSREKDVEEVDDAEPDLDGPKRLVPFDLYGMVLNPPPPPAELIPGLLFEKQVHQLIGHGGSGKSLLCLWMAERLCEQGHVVAYLDHQNLAEEMARRIDSFGFDHEHLIDGRFVYYEKPDVPLSSYADQVVADLTEVGAKVVILDSFTDFLKQESRERGGEGLSENSNDDVMDFYMTSVEQLRLAGMTVVMIDHLSKAKDATMGRGAVVKDDLVQIVYRVTVGEKWNKNKAGRFSLTKEKCRLVTVPEKIKFEVDPTGDAVEMSYKIIWDASDDDTPVQPGLNLGPVEDAVIKALLIDGGKMNTRQIRAEVKGFRADVIGTFLEGVRDDHPLILSEKDGKAWTYWLDPEQAQKIGT